MIRSAIVFLLVNYCAFLFSQTTSFSRVFESSKKNVPIAIINKYSNYFHVLRYNKVAHDFTLERRSKPSAEIISFTPLKLDVINADWFNYENLDYILHEHKHKIYFVFEKILNHRREVFLKVADSTGKTTDFISLAALDKDNAEDIKFEYKITGDNKILVVGTHFFFGNMQKKIALLYDPEKLENIWLKKLPLENGSTGFSQEFECNEAGDLYYILSEPTLFRYKRKYMNQMQMQVPVFSHGDVCMVCIPYKSSLPVKRELLTNYFARLYNVSIYATNKNVYATFHFSGLMENEKEKVFLMNLKWDAGLSTNIYDTIANLEENVEKQLTFYDGTDFKDAVDKDYSLLDRLITRDHLYVLSERKDESFYKELLLVKIELATGVVLKQEIIPRKVIYQKESTRFKNVGLFSRLFCNGNYGIVLTENPRNIGDRPDEFNYHDFSAVGMWDANMMLYSLKAKGKEKKLLYEDGEYDYIPVYTQTEGCDFVFYLSRGKYEKFAILKLYP